MLISVLEALSTPYPLGATIAQLPRDTPHGIAEHGTIWNFAIFSKTPLSHLVLQDLSRSHEPILIPLCTSNNVTGDVWHIQIATPNPHFYWCWASFFNPDKKIEYIQDPYAKLIGSGHEWGKNSWIDIRKGAQLPLGITFDWDSFCKEKHHTLSQANTLEEPLCIYEMHIRGFTKDFSSMVSFPGTFQGAIEKIPYLKKLGITAIELMPISEFDEAEWLHKHPVTQEPLYNYWGYSPLNFFSPHGRYFSSKDPLSWPYEFRRFVDICHDNGIKVILDVVLNHTGEGNEKGPSYSWKKLSQETYYLIDKDGKFLNYSGCGNTLNANHPIVADMLIHSLQHWTLAYGVDGFRFDLASCLTRNQAGEPMSEPMVLERIGEDPILSHTILIMEPWDAAGLYQTGNLYKLNQKKLPRFLEWNDKFRDDVRSFIKGTNGFSGPFATRVCGSQDLYYSSPSPTTSVNFVTAHDGFSLMDLVSYNTKHNLENGEHNRDGAQDNHSWNCGIEGPTQDSSIRALRIRQIHNFMVALILSYGTPMILMADEYGHSKKGNNNTWCHDSQLNWFLWNESHTSTSMFFFLQHLIDIRHASGLFNSKRFLTPSDVEWHGKKPYAPDWSYESRFVAYSLLNKDGSPRLYLAFHMGPSDISLEIPPSEKPWKMYVNTGLTSPGNFARRDEAQKISSAHIKLHSHSTLVLGTF